MERCVAYFRTSSSSNVGEDKDSLARQRLACQNYANQNGLSIVEEFYDPAISGKDHFHERPGFFKLLTYCEENEISIIIFENASRFSREMLTQELGYRELTASGYKLICADAPEYFTENSDNPSANMIRQILGAVAEFQKNELVKKLAGARERKAAINKKLGHTTLDGRGKCGGRYSYHQSDPELVRQAKKLGRRNPKTGYKRSRLQISAELEKLGYVTANGTRFGHEQIARFLRHKLPPSTLSQTIAS